VKQEELNKVRMDDWDSDGLYEQKFQIRLTSKHRLAVGRWDCEGEWGVDMRRWSLDQGRLLGAGLTMHEDVWSRLCLKILQLHEKGLFKSFGGEDIEAYDAMLKVDDEHQLRLGLFEGHVPYLTVTMEKGGKPIWKGPKTNVGIIIRFDSVADLLLKAKETGLIPRLPVPEKKERDPETGREIF
jgi:hypothetical protein